MEILFYTRKAPDAIEPGQSVRWLTVEDYAVFRDHLELCGQRRLDEAQWKRAYEEGIVYCGLFVGGQMVSRACVEKVSVNAWEVADVRTAKSFRGNGYARQVCSFVLKYILAHNKTAMIRTEEDNEIMKRIIERLGFSIL